MKQDEEDKRNGEREGQGDRIKSVNKTNENTDSYCGKIHHSIKLSLICCVYNKVKRWIGIGEKIIRDLYFPGNILLFC